MAKTDGKNEIVKAATTGQQAVISLLLTENSYELEEFERFVDKIAALQARFDALDDTDDPRNAQALENWKTFVDGLGAILGLERSISDEELDELLDADEAEIAKIKVFPYDYRDCLCELKKGEPLKLTRGYGRYYIIPESEATNAYVAVDDASAEQE